MTKRELLVEARKLVAGGWTQKTYSRDAYGHQIPFGDSRCSQFCLSGAVQHAGAVNGGFGFVQKAVLAELRDAIGPNTAIALWNDAKDRTQQEVLDVIDKAIKALDERGDRE